MRWLRMAERLVPAFLPVLTAVVGGVWAVSMFVAAQRDATQKAARQAADTAQARLIEAQKPFLDKQLELYVRASKAVGTLITAEKNVSADSPWATAEREFLSLFWAELPMVENTGVETAMVNVRDSLVTGEKSQLEKRAYCLGHAIRQSIEEGWKVGIGAGGIPPEIFKLTDTDYCKSDVLRK